MFGIIKVRWRRVARQLRAVRGAVAGLLAEQLPVQLMHISIVHLPEDLLRSEELAEASGIRSVDDDGWLIYTAELWLQCEHPAVKAIREYGRRAGCDWVLLDDCAPVAAGLPTFGMDF